MAVLSGTALTSMNIASKYHNKTADHSIGLARCLCCAQLAEGSQTVTVVSCSVWLKMTGEACLLQTFDKDATVAVLLQLQVLPALQGWDALIQQVVDPLIVHLPQEGRELQTHRPVDYMQG